MENSSQPLPDQKDIDAGKTIAIIGYVTIIGWIVALVMHNNSPVKSKFAAFHIRQSLGLIVCALALVFATILVGFVLPFLFFLIPILQAGVVLLVILQIIQAANGKMQGIPIIGDFINKTFSGIN